MICCVCATDRGIMLGIYAGMRKWNMIFVSPREIILGVDE